MAFDSSAADRIPRGWWTPLMAATGLVMPIAAAIAAAIILFLAASRDPRARVALAELARSAPSGPALAVRWVAHLASFGALFAASAVLFADGPPPPAPGVLVAAWLGAAAITIATAALLLGAPARLGQLARALSPALGGGLLLGVAAYLIGRAAQSMWLPLRWATLHSAGLVLRGLVSRAVVRPENFELGTDDFVVEIAPACSGYEGIGLTWAFLAATFWLFRDRLRFPRALWLLVPGTLLPFLVNVLRLVVLVLIGSQVSPAIAMGGFHSYAGTLLFSTVALLLVAGALRVRWLTTAAGGEPTRAAPGADVAIDASFYLVPYLVLVAAGLLARTWTTGAGDDPLQALPLVLTAAALCVYRRQLGAEDRRGSAWALVTGALVAGGWLVLDYASRGGAPLDDAARPGPPANLLVLCLTSIVIVPIAEELAFRGYLFRQLEGLLRGRAGPWAAVALSSLAFGLLHQRPLAAIAAGAAYALLYRRSGRLIDPVLAHAVSNALLIGAAAYTGDWQLWK